ncbi:hypothetical protein GCM10007063_00100 [Lentibacillus kapialis]|uniref:Uncharacterized protein n=1 Tax=Lentibacillus kapialis TaxID=340214 RepID=A0A917PKB2_9BACI|nr:hypothetical protein [Lentibacillus kapialis]GGJ81669.1 hypothetical protein GCM10007063_00100 [Lentibacillus kapialis]
MEPWLFFPAAIINLAVAIINLMAVLLNYRKKKKSNSLGKKEKL